MSSLEPKNLKLDIIEAILHSSVKQHHMTERQHRQTNNKTTYPSQKCATKV